MGKKIFFQARDCYSKIFIIIKGVKMKLRIITRKYAFDTAIESATKFYAYGLHKDNPPVRELISTIQISGMKKIRTYT